MITDTGNHNGEGVMKEVFNAAAFRPKSPMNAGQSSQPAVQNTSGTYASIAREGNRLSEGRKIEGNPTVPAANTVPDTKLGDQMTEVPKPESETLEKSPSTQTEPSDKHKDAPTLPSHQDDGDGISEMRTITDERWTEIKDGVGLQDADPDKKKVTNGHQDEHLSGRPSFQSEKEATKYYRNKYRDFKSENKLLTASEAELAAAKAELAAKNKELHADNSKLHYLNKQIRNENTRLQQALDEEKNRIKQLQNKNAQLQRTLEEERNQNKQLQTKHTQFRTESAQLQRALDDERKRSSTATKKADQLQERLDDLYRSHIHSVNSVNTGLDSISDQNFEEKLDSIHDEIQQWCRKAFKQQPKAEIRSTRDLNPGLQEALDSRRYPTITLRFGHFIETVTWIVLEAWILSPWFPAFDEKTLKLIASLDSNVRCGDTSPTLEKAEYWRAYTASLLFQNPRIQELLQDVKQDSGDLLNVILDVQTAPCELPPEYISELQRIIRDLRTLGAQLRCQRAAYEIDHSVAIGQEYDDTRMHGIQVAALEEMDPKKEKAFVTCILSRGIVKKKYKSSKEVEARICKARVLVAVVLNPR